jgi:hypothetical protein
MKELQFPIQFKFKVTTFSNDFVATDAHGNSVAYVKQKMFKLKEDISVFDDESQTSLAYRIKADRWLDFSAAYSFFDNNGSEIGKIVRKGWRSIWKAEYHLIDQFGKSQYTISEENGFIKVMDSILVSVPFIGIFTGYFFNPSYIVKNSKGYEIVRLTKEPSFLGRHFQLNKVGVMDNDDDDRIMLGLMMMILLERSRG